MNNELYQQVEIPPQGAQVVPVYQGLKPKKPVIENGKFLFQFFLMRGLKHPVSVLSCWAHSPKIFRGNQ